MANIGDITEAWAGHSGLEVETFLKQQLGALDATLRGKFGYVEFNTSTMSLVFYDQEGGTQLGAITLSGDVYTVTVQSNLSQVFYVLADETTKIMTITPSTTVAPFGSSQTSAFPESYTYAVAVNTGNGYITRITGDIDEGGSASFDLRPYLATGDNYIRVSVTGITSGQTRTTVYTGTLTTLTMSCNHTWQNVWSEGQDYVINGIRFAGNLVKTLHVAITNSLGQTTELPFVEYRANQSYTTTSTTYTISYESFPELEHNGIVTISLWMTAQGVSTPVTSFQIMCAKTDDTTPIVAINAITPLAVNYTSGTIFAYAVFNANKVSFNMSATLNSVIYPVTSQPVVATGLDSGIQYQFAYSLEVDTGVNETPMGSLAISAKAYYNSIEGATSAASTLFDNTYSYLATPGALFYLNAAVRSNDSESYQTIINEAGASQDGNFAAVYTANWSGLSWTEDGWSEDDNGIRALVVPAGSSVTFNNFAPLSFFTNQEYSTGMTVELMIKSGHPSNYSLPVFSMMSSGATPSGIVIYPTQISVYGALERDEIKQSVMLSEGRMTHIVITFVRDYENTPTRNLCSIYINGISNVNFSFDGASNFGDGEFVMGQSDTDAYLYKMRVYGTPLDSTAVLNNFFNCITDGLEFNRKENYDKNQVLDGTVVDYAMVKRAGFNTMVVTLTSDATPLPDVDHKPPKEGWPNCSMKFEYAGHPTWNVTVGNVSIDGQGTTSKKYFRWNLRAKTANDTTWLYGDGTTAEGKVGKFINTSGYADIDRITAKKNYASSMQGHKMGMTGLYNDLFKQVGLGSHLPNEIYQVAVYQFPFVGFRYYEANDTYEYIGIYTAGPDKGSKETFGYKKSPYPNCLSIEGPNHDPLGTRFLVPWVDVEYNHDDETLTFGGEEGWDVDYVKYETTYKDGQAKPDDWAAIRALYESEWRPAYELVYHCSPYIEPLSAALTAGGYADIEALNADIDNFRLGGMTNGIKNTLLSFYDSNYDIWFYRISANEYQNLSTVEGSNAHNIKTYLGLTGNPTKAEIIAARAAKFVNDAPNYWDIQQTLYHYCFCVFLGVTDNFAKNSYPFKFRKFEGEDLATGESVYVKRWGWRQDDLDTVLATDNNGRNTKPYYVEHGDVSGTGVNAVEIFQGGDSALWVLIRENYESAIKEMMSGMMTAFEAIASRNNIVGNTLHDSVFNVISFYCWEHSAKYFSQTLYETDRRWSYIEPWLINPSEEYNNVKPLDQALGDEYQAERLWVERRIAYMFSKYRIGAFSGTNTDYGGIAITLASPFTFDLTPAIELYPVGSVASTDYPAGNYSPDNMRTPPGTVSHIALPAGGASNNYIHGADWLSDLGDLSKMVLTDRSTGENISFSVQSQRLQTLKVGDEDANEVDFNATSLDVSSPTVTEIDAQNTTTVHNIVNLLNCPRLRTCLFEGSGALGLYLPVGAKLTEVSFPDNASTVFMHSLPFLQSSGLTLPALAGITTLYYNNCPNINPWELVGDILETTGETLTYATLIWNGVIDGDVDAILALSEKNGRVVYDGSVSTTTGKPYVEGMARIPGMYADQLDELDIQSTEIYQNNLRKALSGLFGTSFYIIYNPNAIGIRFADANVETICLDHWDTDHNGVLSETEAATPTGISTYFTGNTTITEFNELRYFIGLTAISGGLSSPWGGFKGCTALTKITIPKNVTTIGQYSFSGCSALTEMTFENVNGGIYFRSYAFTNTTTVARINISNVRNWGYNTLETASQQPFPNHTSSSGVQMYYNGALLQNVDLSNSSVSSINQYTFSKVKSIRTFTLASPTRASGGFTIGAYAFYYCSNLRSITIPSNLTSIGASAFEGCSYLSSEIVLPSTVTSVGGLAFMDCSRLYKLVIPSSVSSITSGVLQNTASSFADASRGILEVNCPFTFNGSSSSVRYGNIGFHRQYYNAGLSYGANADLFTSAQVMHIKIVGNLSFRSTNGFRYSTSWFCRLILLEITGTLTRYSASGTNVLLTSNWWNSTNYGFMLHLSYNGVACIPGIIPVGRAALSKIYVGDGSSADHDNAILQQYMDSSDWSGSTSKLDTWYNYLNSGWTLDDQIAMGLKQGFVAINRALTSTAATTFAFSTVNGLCVTDIILLTEGNNYTYYVGNVSSSYKRVFVSQAGAQVATTGITATTFTAGSTHYGVRLTVSMAAIQAGQAYMINNTTGKIVWPNNIDFTPNSHD